MEVIDTNQNKVLFQVDFCNLFDSDELSDVTIILDDGIKRLPLKLHRVILYNRCKFFKGLFTDLKESHAKENVIQVINVDIAKDIIKKIYGFTDLKYEKDWRYMLKYYKCCDYFMLDPEIPKNVKVSTDQFDELFDLLDEVGYNEDTMKIIADNMPTNYNLSNLPIEFIKEFDNYVLSSDFAYINDKYELCISNKDFSSSRKILDVAKDEFCYISKMNKFVCMGKNILIVYDLIKESTEIFHFLTVKSFQTLLFNEKINKLVVKYTSHKNKKCICTINPTTFKFSKKIYKTNKNDKIHINMCALSKSGNKLVYTLSTTSFDPYKYEEKIYVYDFNTKKTNNNYELSTNTIKKILFINNENDLIYHYRNHYCEVKVTENSQTKIVASDFYNIDDIEVYQDKYFLIAAGGLYIYDLKKFYNEITPIHNFTGNILLTSDNKAICYRYHMRSFDLTQIQNLSKTDEYNVDRVGFYGIKNICPIQDKYSLKSRIQECIRGYTSENK
ncbi:BTB/POZ domain-containing protein [Acanthamoeba polyphaga moumouvirus]|uniref:BTB/POZ domain-containing protein n=2 Tax=Moumouvirus TaxID=3080801 RepID=L7RGW2_9VIRU|nr:BTB/POZ domain-containing protein [Acanthamoeba polyphaga moumouvirus]AEX62239.1 putative BTB_POZ domain-containing protein [Moumouvirus Monve]AGC02380.1 BTB/POZ domain-containing protein [Acanthamoeba polyphaga moumouvirus]